MALRRHFLLTASTGCLLAPIFAAAEAIQVTTIPSAYENGYPTAMIGGAVTPTPLSVSLYDSTFGSNYWPYVATDSSGQNTLIPTSPASDAPFVAQTTNAGNQPAAASQAATSAPVSAHSSQTSSTPSTTLVIQTGNMAAGYGSTVGLSRPAAVVIGAAVIIGGAMI